MVVLVQLFGQTWSLTESVVVAAVAQLRLISLQVSISSLVMIPPDSARPQIADWVQPPPAQGYQKIRGKGTPPKSGE